MQQVTLEPTADREHECLNSVLATFNRYQNDRETARDRFERRAFTFAGFAFVVGTFFGFFGNRLFGA